MGLVLCADFFLQNQILFVFAQKLPKTFAQKFPKIAKWPTSRATQRPSSRAKHFCPALSKAPGQKLVIWPCGFRWADAHERVVPHLDFRQALCRPFAGQARQGTHTPLVAERTSGADTSPPPPLLSTSASRTRTFSRAGAPRSSSTWRTSISWGAPRTGSVSTTRSTTWSVARGVHLWRSLPSLRPRWQRHIREVLGVFVPNFLCNVGNAHHGSPRFPDRQPYGRFCHEAGGGGSVLFSGVHIGWQAPLRIDFWSLLGPIQATFHLKMS